MSVEPERTTDDVACDCGHAFEDHDPEEAFACMVNGCDCSYFALDEAEALR